MFGTSKVDACTLHQLQIGTIRSDFFMAHAEPRIVEMFDNIKTDDGVPIEGMLGHDFLDHFSAVVDYRHAKLYLLPPQVLEQPPLTGMWQCVAANNSGVPAGQEWVTKTRIESADSQITFRTPTQNERFHVHFLPGYEPKRALLYQKAGGKGDGKVVCSSQACYTVSGDELHFCMKSDGGEHDPWDKVPVDFKPALRSGWLSLHLERVQAK